MPWRLPYRRYLCMCACTLHIYVTWLIRVRHDSSICVVFGWKVPPWRCLWDDLLISQVTLSYYTCTHWCMYIYVYIYMYIHIQYIGIVYICIYTYMKIYIIWTRHVPYTYIYMYTYMYLYIYLYIYVYI